MCPFFRNLWRQKGKKEEHKKQQTSTDNPSDPDSGYVPIHGPRQNAKTRAVSGDQYQDHQKPDLVEKQVAKAIFRRIVVSLEEHTGLYDLLANQENTRNPPQS